MPDSVYQILDREGLSQFNRGRGLELTYTEEPELVYKLPGSDVNVYSNDPSFEDDLHPFRPSGSYVIEAFVGGRRKFFSLDEEALDLVDRAFVEAIDDLDSPSEYYKKINSSI